MNPELHAAELEYSLSGNGNVRLKVFVFKKISTVNLKSQSVYLIRTALKVSIYNKENFNINPGAVTSFMNYPALFRFSKYIQCNVAAERNNFRLLAYSPITVNASITTSRSDTMDKTLTNSSQQSMGSMSSQTNSFGINVQGGEMMALPMWSVGVSYDYAYTSAQNQERSTALGNSQGEQNNTSDTYSIKDWGIYAAVDRENLKATWVCAQEYPWDVLQYRNEKGDGSIEIPQAIKDRMLIGSCVLPPSQLSLFGTDFTFAAEWSFTPSELNVDTSATLFSIGVDTSYVLASHQRTGTSDPFGLSAKLSNASNTSKSMVLTWWDLECLALNAVVPGRNDASLNLDKLPSSRFPSAGTVPLTVTSPTNTLLCVANGFGPGMIADIATATCSFTLAFKVTDTVGDLSLYLKHWKVDGAALLLSISVNGVDLPAQLVDAAQGGGSTANRTEIVLRSTDYTAEDFCDWIVVGLNVVKVSIAVCDANPPSATARYCLAAAVVA